MTDAIQILLQQPACRLAACLLLALALMQGIRLASFAATALRYACTLVVPVWRPWTAVKVAGLGGLLYAFAGPIHGGIEYMEQHWFSPVYLSTTTPDTAALLAKYETEIRRHVDSYEFSVLKAETEKTAAAIGSTPVAIYETAYLECGLNPFRVRDDGVAAGWIQFTPAGLSGLNATMEQVKHACRVRDILYIMRLTDRYLKRKHTRAGAKPLNNGIDLYLAVFAPAFIGAPAEAVVYSGYNNRAYFLNSGLDGWRVDGGKIVKGAKDGRITVGEIFLFLERKKAQI